MVASTSTPLPPPGHSKIIVQFPSNVALGSDEDILSFSGDIIDAPH